MRLDGLIKSYLTQICHFRPLLMLPSRNLRPRTGSIAQFNDKINRMPLINNCSVNVAQQYDQICGKTLLLAASLCKRKLLYLKARA